MKPQIDTATPGERWEFDCTVAEAFDNMLERSIPNYEIMRELVTEVHPTAGANCHSTIATLVERHSRYTTLPPAQESQCREEVHHLPRVQPPVIR